MIRSIAWIGLAFLVLIAGCTKPADPSYKPTYPVTGKVMVDGQPADGLKVDFHDEKGFDKEKPSMSSSITDAEGKFSVSTYNEGDGVPAGTYKVTFFWGQLNLLSMQYGGPDKLNGHYATPDKTPITVTVITGNPTDMGVIELSAKGGGSAEKNAP